jgi:hypothetical protein
MYYDHRLPNDLIRLLEPNGPLSWLSELVRSPWGHDERAHIQWRRDRGGRIDGGIQLYIGRTSPLEVVRKAGSRVQIRADKRYRDVAPTSFGPRIEITDLKSLSAALEAHVREVARNAARSFLDGEAVSHAGMMRRYGLGHQPGDPLLAVDSEIRVGFRSVPERTKFESVLRAQLQLPSTNALPRKLDTIGILTDGNAGIVEVKDEHGDLGRAIVQVAAHMFIIKSLVEQPGYDLVEVINGMADQKASVGLIRHGFGRLKDTPQLVPIVAAPESRTDWITNWLQATSAARSAHAGLLNDLRFWKLSPTGELLEEHVV